MIYHASINGRFVVGGDSFTSVRADARYRLARAAHGSTLVITESLGIGGGSVVYRAVNRNGRAVRL